MDQSITLLGETFDLLPERAAFWRERKTLLASDLHWGKTEIFHHFGSPIPDGILIDDLARLSNALVRTKSERLLILGDLVHAPTGLTPNVKKMISDWREQHPDLKISLILGNHDRGLQLDEHWRIDTVNGALTEEPFIFTHDADKPSRPHFTWSGHIHPVCRLSTRADSLRLPCFEIRAHVGFLPAFSAFTGGVDVSTRASKIFAIADKNVIQVQ